MDTTVAQHDQVRLGRGMAANLQKAGHDLVVHDLTRQAASQHLANGATWVDTPHEVAANSDVIFSIVGYPADVREIVLGANGALAGCQSGSTLVDMTNEILLHVRGYRQLTIGRTERIAASLPEHLAIIEALEERNTEVAEKRSRDHTLGLAAFIEVHGQELV